MVLAIGGLTMSLNSKRGGTAKGLKGPDAKKKSSKKKKSSRKK